MKTGALPLLLLAVLFFASSSSLPALALPGEGATALAEGALAAVPTATCGAAMLKNMYCRVLQDPDGERERASERARERKREREREREEEEKEEEDEDEEEKLTFFPS